MNKQKKKEESKDVSSKKENRFFSKLVSFFKNEKLHFILGMFLFALSVFGILSLISFLTLGEDDYNLLSLSYNELAELDKGFQNFGGVSGAHLANLLINKWFGISSFLLLFFGISVAYKLLNPNTRYSLLNRFIFAAFFTIWISLSLGYFMPEVSTLSFIQLGGNHGNEMARFLDITLGFSGVILLLSISVLVFMIISFASTLPFFQKILQFSVFDLFKKKKVASDTDEQLDIAESELEMTPSEEETFEEDIPDDEFEVIAEENSELNFEISMVENEDSQLVEDIPQETVETEIAPEELKEAPEEGEIKLQIEEGVKEEIYDKLAELGEYDSTLDLPHYKYPTFDLLQKYDANNEINLEEQSANKNRILDTLENYGIKIKEIKATVGATVTLYEIIPEAGVRISKIRNLEDDIALSLSALGIRIIAPIPGKGTIGIEVPNKNPQIVSMHSVIASKKFQEVKHELPIVFGKTITNEVFTVDLCKMPHILVAGATGQGKSVGLNAIITSLLYKKHPSQLKFVLIDPKKVEFSIYSNIEKYFLAKLPDADEPIITDVTKVVQTLNSLTKEMDARYDLLKKAHVRTIIEYNGKFVKRILNPEKGHRFLPYIVVIIDEFGDLIMTAGKDIELPIARIAQLARAVGIHMIIATQRPSTNIITGSIKANFPARVAFKVSSMIDSRTILDCPGANQLIGRGDMLISQGSDLVRIQCAFVDTPEIDRICSYIEGQRGFPAPFYLPEADVSNGGDTNISGVDLSQRDPMFEEAARLLVIHQQGSTSMIQRKFSIGYNRAGRIVDQLEAVGILGPPDGSKPRQVLVQDDVQLERILLNLK
ncbi:MAG: DNA translocase FtsK 4TM domain-containing protein [Paludibacteraceae bacterium]|nr:DNA translocase FtsK 4TM domain-containing protein [Paludibacteraceae bacterium]